tara:strand:+ start:1836 stop:2021 length:186 start_codon:yes stop_codon:yes gene_type:complete
VEGEAESAARRDLLVAGAERDLAMGTALVAAAATHRALLRVGRAAAKEVAETGVLQDSEEL